MAKIKQEKYFEAILNNLSGGLISIDSEESVVYINPMACKILHMETDETIIGKKFDKVFADFPALMDVIRETIKSGRIKRRAEIRIMHANTPLIIGYSTLMVKEGGKNLGIAVIFQDISFVASKNKSG